MKAEGGCEVRMEGDEIKFCISVCGYSFFSMYFLYRKGNELLWLLLIISVGAVEPNSRFIYRPPPFFLFLVRERGVRKIISAFMQCSWETLTWY